MENRREHYRHSFGPRHQLRVRLTSPDDAERLDAEVVDLSLGGMRVRAEALSAEARRSWVAVFDDADADFKLRITAEPIHEETQSEREVGFRFLYPAYITKKEEIEQRIWRFLLEEQRLERRQQREELDKAG